MDARAELQKLTEAPDARARACSAHQLLNELSALSSEATRVRREAVEELVAQKMSQADIGKLLDISRSRVGQILNSGPRPERAFLGTGELTVALGGKEEGNKTKPGPVVSTEDLAGYSLVYETAKDLGLKARYEIVQPPGLSLNVNRDNLIVACGPRLSPLIAAILQADQYLGFEKDKDGWFIRDKVQDTIYRSPMDSGDNIDFSYFARLPRFDSQGTFLYSAGIHAPGVSGGLHYMVNNLAELYSKVKKSRFSMVISTRFDPETHEVLETKALTPVYQPEKEG